LPPGQLSYIGDVDWKPVVQRFASVGHVILHLTVTSEDGDSEIVGTTLTHPFWVADGAWVQAGNLAVGDPIASHDNGILTVTKRRAAHELHDTFNFEVADFHTYFVGEVGAWVHNVCTPHTTASGGRAPKTSTPDSIYEVMRPDGSARVTYYDEFGRSFSREDYGQQRTHGVLGRGPDGLSVPHEHPDIIWR